MQKPLPGTPQTHLLAPERLKNAWATKGESYTARTRHTDEKGEPFYTNRLFFQNSPYLLQHAHNPVNWFAWGQEAFELAKAENKPVLLSVGYSTCHWCHVMEEESFEDEQIAETLNTSFISIKVDREERPDVDAVYMAAVQLMSGHGGWPMTVFMTPEKVPFFAGTYFPAHDGDRGARVGFLNIVKTLAAEYQKQSTDIAESAAQLKQAVAQMLELSTASDAPLGSELQEKAFAELHERYDSEFGGLAPAPKFPSSLPVSFLFAYDEKHPHSEAKQMALHSLKCMAAGGIHDHVGGGFHRYSTDRYWLVPHFEKMLYDNALLAMDYLEAFEKTGDKQFAWVCQDILEYVKREMTHEEGGFYSATDADSLGPDGSRQEGWFFSWTPDELSKALGQKEAELCKRVYSVSEGGNFEGRSIFFLKDSFEHIAAELELSTESLRERLDAIHETLRKKREQRPAPLLDDKTLLAWNALMISAFAKAAQHFKDADYGQVAVRGADFLLNSMQKDRVFYRSYRAGALSNEAYLEDYACLIAALLDVFDASAEPRYLREAFALEAHVAEHFEDKDAGGFFMTSHRHEKLLARQKPFMNGAEPSGNSVMAQNLLRLYTLGLRQEHYTRLEKLLGCISPRMNKMPSAFSDLLVVAQKMNEPLAQCLVVYAESKEKAAAFSAVFKNQHPGATLLELSEAQRAQLEALLPWLCGKKVIDNKATAYLCQHGECTLPATELGAFENQLPKS